MALLRRRSRLLSLPALAGPATFRGVAARRRRGADHSPGAGARRFARHRAMPRRLRGAPSASCRRSSRTSHGWSAAAPTRSATCRAWPRSMTSSSPIVSSRAASRSCTTSCPTPASRTRRSTTTTATGWRWPTSTATAVPISTSSTRSAATSSGGIWATASSRTSPTTAGVAVAGKVSVSASFADIDNDGDEDLFVTTVRGGNMLFENDGHGRFRDISAAAGLDYVGHSSGGVFFDYDHDGRLDLFVVNVGRYTSDDDRDRGRPEVSRRASTTPSRATSSRNGRKRASSITTTATTISPTSRGRSACATSRGPATPAWSTSTRTAGRISTCSTCRGTISTTRTPAGKRFVRKSRDVFPRTSWGAMGIKVFDVNNDGRMDIFITDMHSDMSEEIRPGARDGMKSDMQWPESFRGDGSDQHLGQLVLPQGRPGQVPRSVGRDRTSRTTARGARASATSTPTASTTCSSPRG